MLSSISANSQQLVSLQGHAHSWRPNQHFHESSCWTGLSCECRYRIGIGTVFCKRNPSYSDDYDLLPPILPNSLRTIPQFTCLIIAAEYAATLDSSLTSTLLHLLNLPTIKHIEISFFRNSPLSSLTSSAYLFDVRRKDGFLEIIQSEKMLREFRTYDSSLVMTNLLHAKLRDSRPAFNFMDLRRLSISSTWSEEEQKYSNILQNAKFLEKLHLSVNSFRSMVRLLSPSARTLKVLVLTVLYRF